MRTLKTRPRPSRQGVRISSAPRPNRKSSQEPAPTGLPPIRFQITNFKDGRTITFSMKGGVYRYQLDRDKEVQTEATTYPQASAIARRHYGLPPIGCASYAKPEHD